MIITAFLNFFAWVMNWLGSIQPQHSFQFSENLGTIFSYMWAWDWLLPMVTIQLVLTGVIVYFSFEFAWRSTHYVVRVVRGI